MRLRGFLIVVSVFLLSCNRGDKVVVDVDIPLPSEAQVRYQNYERTMFLCLDPCTWQGREYDNHTTDLADMKLSALDTDQWCEVAQSWGAKLILFVAKHTGGFCWWQTKTSDYSVKNIYWKDGKGDVLAELSNSCKKYGLDLGIYVYPGDDTWGAGIGSGGKTADPEKQDGYNEVFRQQMTEVLTKYGAMKEVWFDGSCVIDVSDILKEHAKDAVIFQGPHATVRWVGNENGIAPYPNWYTLSKEDAESGKATAVHSAPDGDIYAPVEMDVPLLINGGHKWFWSAGSDHLLPSVGKLMDIYYKSSGRGGVLLLNSTPDTSGLIPESHVDIYKAFGEEIHNRFYKPLSFTSFEGNQKTIKLGNKTNVDHIIIQEDISHGQRIREYVLEAYVDGKWEHIYTGSSVGTKKIDRFKTINTSKIRIRIIDSAGEPVVKNFAALYVGEEYQDKEKKQVQGYTVGGWTSDTYTENWKELEIDLTSYIDRIGQYEISFQLNSREFDKAAGLEFRNWTVKMYGEVMPEVIERQGSSGIFVVTRSQQTEGMDEYPTVLNMEIRSKAGKSTGNIEIRRIEY